MILIFGFISFAQNKHKIKTFSGTYLGGENDEIVLVLDGRNEEFLTYKQLIPNSDIKGEACFEKDYATLSVNGYNIGVIFIEEDKYYYVDEKLNVIPVEKKNSNQTLIKRKGNLSFFVV